MKERQRQRERDMRMDFIYNSQIEYTTKWTHRLLMKYLMNGYKITSQCWFIRIVCASSERVCFFLSVWYTPHYKNWFTIKCGNFHKQNSKIESCFPRFLSLLSSFFRNISIFDYWFYSKWFNVNWKWDFINLIDNLILNSIHSILDQWRQWCNIIHTYI